MNLLDSQLKQLDQDVNEISQKIDKLYADKKASEEEVSDSQEQISDAPTEKEHFEWQKSKIGRKTLEVCDKVLCKATCNVLLLKISSCLDASLSLPLSLLSHKNSLWRLRTIPCKPCTNKQLH